MTTSSEHRIENFDLTKHNFSTKDIKPLNEVQTQAFESYFSNKNLLLHGVAGTGKTFIALYLALNDLLQGKTQKILIVRSAVTTRDQGFLPGNLTEKMQVYEAPYQDIVESLLGRGDAYEVLKKRDYIQFMSTSFIRGLTFDNTVIIVDEAQNMSLHEMSSILTRVGKRCRIIICGDSRQDDLSGNKKNKEQSGFVDTIAITHRMKNFFDVIEFGIQDIVRSGFCKDFLIAKINLKLD